MNFIDFLIFSGIIFYSRIEEQGVLAGASPERGERLTTGSTVTPPQPQLPPTDSAHRGEYIGG